MKHDNLIYIINKKYPNAVHGRDFWTAHRIDKITGEQKGGAFILEWNIDSPEPSQEEISQLWDMYGEEAIIFEKTSLGRAERDNLLTELDKFISNPLRYSSLTKTQKDKVSEYRQLLLDVPQQEGFPLVIEWPVKPEFI